MKRGNLSRRGFLQRSLAGMVGAGLPLWYAQETMAAVEEQDAQRAAQGKDKIVMGAIGVGTNYLRRGKGKLNGERGIAIMNIARGQPGVQFTAVCDVDSHNKEYAAGIVGRGCQQFEDYKRLLEDKNIQAVTIGTPDHWHALIAVAAMRAGKDVYCEKPLTLTLDEGKLLVQTAQKTNKILQTGSQQRSEYKGMFRIAAEMVRNNRIGQVRKITTIVGDNPQTKEPFRIEAAPKTINWDFWLGPTPRVEYVKQRCHYDFRWWYEYSGGKMTDWGAHHNDIAQWALGMDDSGPTQIHATSGQADTRANCYNCHPNFVITYRYANGVTLECRANAPQNFKHGNNGILFEGDKNQWIWVSRGNLTASDRRILDDPLPEKATRLEVSTNHMANFLSCVRSRRQPICHPVVGHRSCSVCHLGNIAVRLGRNEKRPLRWDPRKETFLEDEDANRMLSRNMREPYRFPQA